MNFDPDEIRPALAANVIAGRVVLGCGETFEVSRPSDGRFLGALHAVDPAQMTDAVVNAVASQKASGWGKMAPRSRARLLRRWADLIDAADDALGRLEAVSSTRTIGEVLNWDLPYAAECIRFFAEYADKIGGETVATGFDRFGFTLTEPYGVVAAIAPWNLPLVMAVWKVAPALAAGNAVVLKPSELTPFTAVILAELALEAGIPPGVFNVVQGGPAIGDALVRAEGVSKVSFTGSTRSGQAIMSACAETGPKPVTLELGGKSPQLLFANADLEQAAATIARAITLNAGQVCVAGSRLLVEAPIYDLVIEYLVQNFASRRLGATWDPSTDMGPIMSERQIGAIDAFVGRAIVGGAQLIAGGARADTQWSGCYYLPTLLAPATGDAEILQNEVFGPVLTIQPFNDEEEAFALANGTSYGLAAGLYTSDLGRALRAAREIEAGTLWINRYGRSDDFVLPTGGFKRSGVGKDLGLEAYSANRRSKSVLIGL